MRNHFATGCLFLGILCFIYFFIIIIYAGLRTSIAVAWVIGGICFLLLWKGLCCLSGHSPLGLRVALWGLGSLMAVGCLVILVLGSKVVAGMRKTAPARLEYALVLGAQVKGTKPSRSLRRRLDAALAYGKDNPDTIFVLSGGKGSDEDISEAECMYNYMTEQGMAPERLLPEDQSTSTKENLDFSDQLYGLKDKRVGIISNNFHIYRGLRLAEKEGYQTVWGIPASSEMVMQPHNILREVVCLLYARIRGHI